MSRKKTAFLKEENLLTLLSQNYFIIPEIQREYVWGENKTVITKFLKDLKNKTGLCCEKCNLPSSRESINIGFLYSYKPEYVKLEHERFLDENLIDGQQRFTTLFLLLFFCALKEKRKEEFLSLIRFEEKIKMSLDFRVRDLTKKFLLELVEKINTTEQLTDIDQQTWFLTDYKNDVSIRAMRKALGYIQNEFSDNTEYYNHLINYVVFWHFKTEATSQGEELYITMNARGEELADNEGVKAALMVDDSERIKWGGAWEDWQQFFWKNRKSGKKNSNSSADKGLNGFLKCIAGLEYYLKDKEGTHAEKDIQKLLSLKKVEKYYKAFQLLLEKKNEFTAQYNYSEWVELCIAEIWKILNDDDTDWFADYKDKNKPIPRNRMIFLWSWLYYIAEAVKKGRFETNELYRILRFFYIRFNNYNRSVSTLKMTIDLILEKGIWGTLDEDMGEEEDQKICYLLKQNNKAVFEIEEAIWQIEDHPLNIDGRDVGNINITHVIDLNDTITLQDIQKVNQCFRNFFPDDTKKGSSILKTILLHYDDFYKDTSYYYYRYDFSDWKRNIRKPAFKKFISDLNGKTPEKYLEELKSKFIADNAKVINDSVDCLPKNLSLRTKLIYYSLLLSHDDLWKEGEKMIICENKSQETRLFEDENKIYNSKGNFKGYSGNSDLWKEVKNTNPLTEIKKRISD